MATCTLDDLVPSLKCNKVTLEPVRSIAPSTGASSVNFGEYDVVIDASVRDRISESSGITEFMLADPFRQSVSVFLLYSRDNQAKNFYNFLTSKEISTRTAQGSPIPRGLTPAQKSFLFNKIIDLVENTQATTLPLFSANKLYILDYITKSTSSQLANPGIAHLSLVPYLTAAYHNLADAIIAVVNDMPTDINIFTPSNVFTGICIRHAIRMIFSDFEYIEYPLSDILSNALTGEYGIRTQDEDGNLIYDVKIPTTFLTFTNSVEVENCCMYMSAYFDITEALAQNGIHVGIPLDYETLNFFYNSVDECDIIANKLPANAIVQDFRIAERIGELIRSDTMMLYDQAIDEISLKSSEFNPDNSSLTSQLYSSYVFEYGVNDPMVFTKNFFYLNMIKLLKRKSKLSFLYENVMVYNMNSSEYNPFNPEMILHLAEIFSMDIYRVRKDEYEPPVLIKRYNGITQIGDPIGNAQLCKFTDTEFMNLTDGEYVYEVKMVIKDPMYDAVRSLSMAAKPMISILKGAIEYIHNNPQHYNEMRGELSMEARMTLLTNFSSLHFKAGVACFEGLLAMFTGQTLGSIGFNDIVTQAAFNPELALEYVNSGYTIEPTFIEIDDYFQAGTFNDVERIDRRKIENFYRICQDLLFGISKFVATPEVVSSADENNIVSKKTNALIYYEREWSHTPVKANLDSRMMIGIQNRQREELLFSDMTAEYTEEINKHIGMGVAVTSNQFSHMNFLTPSYIGGKPIGFNSFTNSIPSETYVKILDATLKKPDVLAGEISTGIYTYAAEGYVGTIGDLRNNSGVFETMLHEHAVTVKNKTARTINTDFELGLPFKRENTFGIDQGRNTSEKTGYPGYTEEEIEAANTELERQQTEAMNILYEEKLKKELLLMNCLVDKDAHHILDRREFIQGSREGLKFTGFNGYDFHKTVQEIYPSTGTSRISYPRLYMPVLTPYCAIANESTHDTHPLRIIGSRFIVDNTFVLFYLERFDEDMNPIWKELLASEMSNSATLRDKALCKLIRFKMHGKEMNIGQGSTSNLEITNQYFYLKS